MKPMDYKNGNYCSSATVTTGRVDLFKIDGKEPYHIGTLVSGSRSKIDRFEGDVKFIVDALANRDS